MQVFFSILTGAVAIGLAGPKIQAVAVARGAANTIFKIIDRVRHVTHQAGFIVGSGLGTGV